MNPKRSNHIGPTVCLLVLCGFTQTFAQEDSPPRSLDDRLEITLFAEDPLLNTPTGIDVDHKGRVWVIESNTHFPPEGYDKHPTDRLLILEDTDGDGKAEAKIFVDGFTHSMSVAARPIWLDPISFSDEDKPEELKTRTQVYLATRREILLLEDTDGDDQCDNQTRLVHLETEGNYPHNGLAGFAFDGLGNMYFGFGENLGADYKIIGRDGTTYSGGAEGGNIYQIQPDGTGLKHWATGFWNPHANCVDAFGQLFSVDNDPDSLPPCRLLHIIEGGNYGYRFRNGRKGLHPFTAWNGEIPGTLPMVAGTGEAPSGILAYEHDAFPEEYLGNLIVTSWGDHRIDRFQLQPKGASFESVAEPFIVGGENFRPVGIALAPDGSLYVSDWVLRDYKIHGKGRVWRIVAKGAKSEIVDYEKITPELSYKDLDKHFESKDLTERRLAAKSIAEKHTEAGTEWRKHDFYSTKNLRENAEWLKFWGNERLLRQIEEIQKNKSLEDRLDFWRAFVRAKDRPFLNTMARQTLNEKDISLDLFIQEFSQPKTNSKVDLPESKQAESIRIGCLLLIRKHFPQDSELPQLALKSDSNKLKRLAVQWIAEENLIELRPQVEALFTDPDLTPDLFLATLAALEMLDGKPPQEFDKTPSGKYVLPILKDESKPANVRAIALRLIDPFDEELDSQLLRELTYSDEMILKREAIRTAVLNPAKSRYCGLLRAVNDESLDINLRAEALVGIARRASDYIHAEQTVKKYSKSENPILAREALRVLRVKTNKRPTEPFEVSGKPDANAGRRLFFHPQGPGCYKCHVVQGRGGNIGPNLTNIGGAMSRE